MHELILKGTNRTWDTLKSEFEAKDFSFTFLESFYFNKTGTHIEPSDYYSFGLVTKDGFLTNAGALFADICPFRQSRVFCTRWNGLTKAKTSLDALDDKEFNGNILQLLESSKKFIEIYNSKLWYKTDSSRIEKQSYPERAIFEALVNAIVHRDYGVIGSEIHIDIFDDRLEIKNPGGMYDGLPVQNQNIEDIISTRRNPVIADFMNRLKLMERRGSGFRKILDAVENTPDFNNSLLPDFNSTAYNFTFILKNLNYSVIPTIIKEENKNVPEIAQRLPRDCPEIAQRTYLALVQNPYATIKELSNSLKISPRTVKSHIALLRDKFIKRIGSDTKGHWEVL